MDKLCSLDNLCDVLDKMKVLTMALWGCENEDPPDKFMSALSSFATDIVNDLEKLAKEKMPCHKIE